MTPSHFRPADQNSGMIGKLPADRLSDPAGKKRFQIRAFFNTIPTSGGQNFFFLIVFQHLPRNRPPPVLFLSAGPAAQGCAAMPLPLPLILCAGSKRTRASSRRRFPLPPVFVGCARRQEGTVTASRPSLSAAPAGAENFSPAGLNRRRTS